MEQPPLGHDIWTKNLRHPLRRLMGTECSQGGQPCLWFLLQNPFLILSVPGAIFRTKQSVGQETELPTRLLRTVSVQELVLKDQESSTLTWLKAGRIKPSFFFFNIYLFIQAAPGLSCSTRDLHYGMRDLSCGMHVGSSSLTRDQTRAPCIGSVESYPLDLQGSP